jgi:opacity protein-like surface antigen
MSTPVDNPSLRSMLLSGLLGATLLAPMLAFGQGSYVSAAVGRSDWDGAATETGMALAYGAPIDSSLGYELGYVYQGKVSGSGSFDPSILGIDGIGVISGSASVQIHSFYAAGTARTPLSGNLAGHAKLGLAANYLSAEVNTNAGGGSTSETNLGAVAGLGLSYKFSPELSGIVDYTYFDRVGGSSTKAQSLHAGLRYHF